jgi:hypothetical protein
MTLYVTLNDDQTLALESDYGGLRSQVASDSPDGPTAWGWNDSWGVPERTEVLVAEAIETTIANANTTLALDIAKDAIVEDFADDR